MSTIKFDHEISFSEIDACLNVIEIKVFANFVNLKNIF